MPLSIILLQRDHEASPHLQALLNAERALRVAGITHTVAHARQLLKNYPPNLFITDMRVQDGEVAPLLRELQRQDLPKPHVLVTTLSHDDAELLCALSSGADGYWAHTSSHEQLIACVKQLLRGESAVSPTIAREILNHLPLEDDALASRNQELTLTRREGEILRWVAKGYLLEEIAQQWQTNLHSVASSVRQVVRKIQRGGALCGV
jgi:DNA-binding NarL/FixJ family response regulator